jgi:PAS domain S-box-containing protein
MQEATRIETERLSGAFSLPRVGHDLRPFFPSLLYLIAYLAADWSMERLGLMAVLGDYTIVAGLNFGLILLYGLWHSPVVVLATVADGLWCHPLPYSVPVAVLYCLSLSLVEISAALVLKRLAPGHCIALKRGSDYARFLLLGVLASAALAAIASMQHAIGDSLQWHLLFAEFKLRLVSFAAGILCVSPVLVIHIGPWLETVLFGIQTEKQSQQIQSPLPGINRYQTLFAVTFACLAGCAIYLILGNQVTDKLHIFLILTLPMIWVAIRRGLEGLSVAALLFMLGCIGTVQYLGLAADLMESCLAIFLTGSVFASMVAVGVTQDRVTQWQMEHRDAILDAVGYAAQRFLGNAGWETGIQEVVRRIGEATSVTRVFLIDNRTPDLGGQVGDMSLYEWTIPSGPAEEPDKRILNLLRSQMIEELSDQLATGQPFVFRTKEMNRKRREMLETLGIRSGVIIPMFVERQWWGCLGLEQCFTDRDWPQSEIDGLNRAGQILGTLIASVRVEQQFRQLTGNIQAVFWISDPDGRTKQYVSPGYEEIWGRTCASLQRDPRCWLDAIHPEDQSRVSEALVKQVWGEYDEEFRVERPDGSVRWVHDRAFPVRDQSGKVSRIVGIAADITKEKQVEEQLRAATVMLSSLINHLHSAVMVEDEARRITHVNEVFNRTFNVPIPPQSLFGVDSRLLFIQTAQFADRLEQIIKAGAPILGEEIEWQGRVFLRNYVPLSINDKNHYHLWQYQDVTDSRKAEAQIKASLKEKEVLLKEIHHRVKNNLQIISSLLNLQSAEIEDPKASQKFRESQDRVKAMALIHERLYQASDLAKIDFAGYVRSLTGHLMRSYKVSANGVKLNLEVDSVPMNLDVAIPCGLMINELVSNSLKYAFPQTGENVIHVRFSEENNRMLKLAVHDNGIGFPENQNPEESDSLGLKLVRTLTEQLGGRIQYRNDSGFLCEIEIPQAKN